MSDPSARKRHAVLRHVPARPFNLSVLGVAVIAIGAIGWLAIPGASGTRAAEGGAGGHASVPGPMPGAPSPSQQPTLLDTPVPTGQPTSTPTPTALQPTNAPVVKTWNSGHGGRALAALTQQAGEVVIANATQQYADMLLDCEALSTAVDGAQQATPIPDTRMQLDYSLALTAFKLATGDCIAGIQVIPNGVEDTVTNVNQVDLAAAITELHTGTALLYVGTEMLRRQ
jgi:hypothetical protein